MSTSPRSEVIHVRVKPILREKIKQGAMEADISASQLIRSVLVNHFEGGK